MKVGTSDMILLALYVKRDFQMTYEWLRFPKKSDQV